VAVLSLEVESYDLSVETSMVPLIPTAMEIKDWLVSDGWWSEVGGVNKRKASKTLAIFSTPERAGKWAKKFDCGEADIIKGLGDVTISSSGLGWEAKEL
jgi:hypothetical protein